MYKYNVIKSDRKSFCIEISATGEIKVRVPYKATKEQIEHLISEKGAWILRTLKKIDKRRKESVLTDGAADRISEAEAAELRNRAVNLIEPKVEYWAEIIGVEYKRITIRGQKTRWGSCSSKANLNFNYLLALCPESVVDYVIIHELCHLIHMNHSKNFWDLVGRYCPDFNICRAWLRKNGGGLIEKLPL